MTTGSAGAAHERRGPRPRARRRVRGRREDADYVLGRDAAELLRPRGFAHLLLLAIVAFFALFFAWASWATLDEVTRGQGRVIPSSQVQMVQNLEGGIVSAILSAPIAAVVFGGVTGSGTDLLVAAFQQAGADLQTAVLQQGLISDPIDKTVTFFVVFVLLQALSRRYLARFPQGEKAVGLEEA